MRRFTHDVLSGLLLPGTLRQMAHAVTEDFEGALCLMCNKPVDKEEVVEGYQATEAKNGVPQYSKLTYCKILVTCHGQEELHTFDMGTTEWEPYDVQTRMRRRRWFDPEAGHEDAGIAFVPEAISSE